MFGGLLSWWDWLTIYLAYLIAAALIAGGGYLAFVLVLDPALFLVTRFLRGIGHLLMWAGLILAAVTYGKSVASAECEQRWAEKNYEARIARLEQEKSAKEKAAEVAARQAHELAGVNDENQRRIFDYETEVGKLSAAVAACRRATRSDDRRVCELLGAAAAGCRHPD